MEFEIGSQFITGNQTYIIDDRITSTVFAASVKKVNDEVGNNDEKCLLIMDERVLDTFISNSGKSSVEQLIVVGSMEIGVVADNLTNRVLLLSIDSMDEESSEVDCSVNDDGRTDEIDDAGNIEADEGTSIWTLIWKKTRRLWVSLGFLAASVFSAWMLNQFISSGGGMIRGSAFVAPLIFGWYGIKNLFGFFADLFSSRA